MPKTIDIAELILRDAHQSVMATGMAIEDMVPACEDLDQAGFWSLECWGGATFDSCIRFLNEDPWERLRTFRKLLPNTRLQMLLRGQSLQTGDVMPVLEAMKMETNITAPGPGKIAAIPVNEGDSVQSGQVVVEFE